MKNLSLFPAKFGRFGLTVPGSPWRPPLVLVFCLLFWAGCGDDNVEPTVEPPPALEDVEDLSVVQILQRMQAHFATEIDSVRDYSLLTDERLNIYVKKVADEAGPTLFVSAVTPQTAPGVQPWIRKGNLFEIWNRSAFAALTEFDTLATAFTYKRKDVVDGAPVYVLEVDRAKLLDMGPEARAIFDDPDTSGGTMLDLYIDARTWMIRQIRHEGPAIVQTVTWDQYFDTKGMLFPRQRTVLIEGEGLGLDAAARAQLQEDLVDMRSQLTQIESRQIDVGDNYDSIVATLRADVERAERQLAELLEGKRREFISIQEVRVNEGVPVKLFESL